MHKYINTDIVITDPCYLISSLDSDSMWKESKYGEDLDNIGINDFESTSTIYGDWSCTTYSIKINPILALKDRKSKHKKKSVGKFCADSGMVCFGPLENVLKINPDFTNWVNEHSWCVTIIPNFTGNISFFEYRGDMYVIAESTIGNNYFTKQTGL